MSHHYQIGTSEPRGCTGSRAAKSISLSAAIEECRQYSLARSIKLAWLRPVTDGKLGEVLVTFNKGHEVFK